MRRSPTARCCLLLLILSVLSSNAADDEPSLPRAVGEEHFASLKKHSPFLRMLSLEETYALHGIATIGSDTFITLQHRKTKKTITVNGDEENEQGMRLLTVNGSNPENVAVKITYGGSAFEFAYEQAIIQPKGVTPPGTRDTIRRERRHDRSTGEKVAIPV